jgi:hypothetical protein
MKKRIQKVQQNKNQEKYEQIRNAQPQVVQESKPKKLQESDSQKKFRLMNDDMREIMEAQAKIANSLRSARKSWAKTFESRLKHQTEPPTEQQSPRDLSPSLIKSRRSRNSQLRQTFSKQSERIVSSSMQAPQFIKPRVESNALPTREQSLNTQRVSRIETLKVADDEQKTPVLATSVAVSQLSRKAEQTDEKTITVTTEEVVRKRE